MIVIILILGCFIGSFLNVCIHRIPRNESITFPPSHCCKCKNRIKIYDLIPLISYILLKGRCRSCGEKISMRYPFIEGATGFVFTVIYIQNRLTINFINFTILMCFLIVIGVIDYDTTDVYFKTILLGMITGILFLGVEMLYYEVNIIDHLMGCILGGGFIGLIVFLTKGMGAGDIEICALSGLFLGLKLTVIMLFTSFILGGIIGGGLLLLKIKTRKDAIPFGPFIVMATINSILFGKDIITFYKMLL